MGRSCAGSTFRAHETLAGREKRIIFPDFLVSPFARAMSNWLARLVPSIN
jgi:hypothetical protein